MTICEKCGTEREYIAAECPDCQFQPKTVRELSTAALLTTEFEAGDETFGTEPQTLDVLAQGIRAGELPVLDEDELLRHERTVEAFLEVKPTHVYRTLFAIFLPGIWFLAVPFAIILLLKFLRN